MIIDKKLIAYDFLTNSGLSSTTEKAGYTGQKLFGDPYSLTYGISLLVYSLLSLLGVVFLGLTIYAGIMWMIAEGDEAKVEKAKKILTQSVIGLVIILAAYAISFFVINAIPV